MILLQARYAQAALESLIEINKTGDRKLKAQGFIVWVHGLILTGFPITARLYLSEVCKIIHKAKLRFLPVCERPTELSEQVREDAAVLSQAIYLDNYLYLTSSVPTSVMTARIEEEFRLDFEVSAARWSFVVGLQMDSADRSSEHTRTYSTYAR